MKKYKEFGKSEENSRHHHATYYKQGTGIVLSGAVVKDGREYKKYLVSDSLETLKWKTWESTKTLLGYECRPFMSLTEKNDTILVWYSPALSFPFGPSKYIGFSGLVLEVYDQRYGLVWKAVKIEEITATPVFPAGGIIVTKEEFTRLREK